MNFTVSDISAPGSAFIKQLYEAVFPPHEIRPWHEQLQLLKTGKLQAYEISVGEIFIGFIFYWQLNGFVFIEHFAIVNSARGKGTGGKILQQFTERFDTVILETEPPGISVDAVRRIKFYEKAGFVLFDEPYQQPPYVQDSSYFPMRLMLHNRDCSQINFEQIKHEIYTVVYGIK